jgi:nitrous oxide reductase
MSVSRRKFLEATALTVAAAKVVPGALGSASRKPGAVAAVSKSNKGIALEMQRSRGGGTPLRWLVLR